MNTAPQDDFSGDLARDLGGWSNDALLKELSRRTNLSTDAEHELISTGAGVHLQHRDAAGPITVSYDSESTEWTIKVSGLRWTNSNNANLQQTAEIIPGGTFPDKSWTFTNRFDVSIPSGWVYIGWAWPAILLPVHPSQYVSQLFASSYLNFAVEYSGGTPTTPAIENDATDKVNRDGQFQHFAYIYLQSSGSYTIYNSIPKPPHVVFDPVNRGDSTSCFYDSSTSTLYVYNLLRGNATAALSDSLSFAIPTSTEDVVQYGMTAASSDPQLKLRNDVSVDWIEPQPLQICKIKTDSSGNLVYLHPFTQRMAYNTTGGTTTYLAKISSRTAYNEYVVDIYGNGIYQDDGATANTATETGVTVYIPQISSSSDSIIPNATVVIIFKVGAHYECQPPIWL